MFAGEKGEDKDQDKIRRRSVIYYVLALDILAQRLFTFHLSQIIYSSKGEVLSDCVGPCQVIFIKSSLINKRLILRNFDFSETIPPVHFST